MKTYPDACHANLRSDKKEALILKFWLIVALEVLILELLVNGIGLDVEMIQKLL